MLFSKTDRVYIICTYPLPAFWVLFYLLPCKTQSAQLYNVIMRCFGLRDPNLIVGWCIDMVRCPAFMPSCFAPQRNSRTRYYTNKCFRFHIFSGVFVKNYSSFSSNPNTPRTNIVPAPIRIINVRKTGHNGSNSIPRPIMADTIVIVTHKSRSCFMVSLRERLEYSSPRRSPRGLR